VKPKAEDVAGSYTIKSQTVTVGGLSALQGKPCVVELRADGSFTATNIPPFQEAFSGTNYFTTLVSGSGTWRIDGVGLVSDGKAPLKTHWGIYLDSPIAKFEPAGLTAQTRPFGLIFTLGDPDGGQAIILERAR
jgi:hypothetical protein